MRRNDGTTERGCEGRRRIPLPSFRPSVAFLFVAACTPATTRPSFAPYPEALHAIINVRPAQVTEEAKTWLAAQGATVEHASPIDGFLETGWYDARDSIATPIRVKVRLWADPDVPGKSRVTVEGVYRPIEDPSRTARDLERAVPENSAGQRLVERLLKSLSAKLGVTKE
jgi:hypothetical protein